MQYSVSDLNKRKKFQRKLPTLSQQPKGKLQSLITTRPAISGIAGVVKKIFDPFRCAINYVS